jgi:Flp pilus assembly protein TadG
MAPGRLAFRRKRFDVKRMPAVAARRKSCRGLSLLYAVVTMAALAGMVTLAVDFGRAQVAKAELQTAADSAARYALSRFVVTNGDVNTAISAAQAAASNNTADGQSVSLSSSTDISFINWNSTNKSYTTLTGSSRSTANAIRVRTSRSVPLIWATIFGRGSISVTAEAIVCKRSGAGSTSAARSAAASVNGEASVWYAGRPAGSSPYGGYGDTSTRCKPVQITLPGGILGGEVYTFTGISGFTWPSEWIGHETNPANTPAWIRRYAEGDDAWDADTAAMNGISAGTNIQIHALVGVFLDDNDPALTAAPSSINFGGTRRNFDALAPQLKQVFHIGDGMTDTGTLQRFTAPQGATRLYLGIMDLNGLFTWNAGTIDVTVNAYPTDASGVQVR